MDVQKVCFSSSRFFIFEGLLFHHERSETRWAPKIYALTAEPKHTYIVMLSSVHQRLLYS